MNKECRDKLNKIKEQSYRLFLQNLLNKEEGAYREVRRVQLKYSLTKKFDNVLVCVTIKI